MTEGPTLRIRRPTLPGIFMSLALVLIGFWLVLPSAYHLYKTSSEFQELVDTYYASLIENTDDLVRRDALKKERALARQSFKEQYNPQNLKVASDAAWGLRDRNIHHVYAVVLGLFCIVAGSVTSLLSLLVSRRAWTMAEAADPAATVLYSAAMSSVSAAWITVLVGALMLSVSGLMLNELRYYQNTARLIGWFNMTTMTHLKFHYLNGVMMGASMLLPGLAAAGWHYLTNRRASNQVERNAARPLKDRKV